MAFDRDAVARELFEGVMAPLVLGGAVLPGHAIGARRALVLGKGDPPALDPELEERVTRGRVRRARRLAPVDRLAPPSPAEWALASAFHDVLQAANPSFDAVLRRSYAARILEMARAAIERVAPPATVREALERHSWFARVLDVARTDTAVSWWVGSRTYLGVPPPRRLQAWPDLRKVTIVATPRPLVELAPLAVDRGAMLETIGGLLARTPLTEIATCTRAAPPFSWTPATLALATTRPGRTLALRALDRLAAPAVDAALGRATRDLLGAQRAIAAPAVTLLAERAIAHVQAHPQAHIHRPLSAAPADAAFARGLGAVAAMLMLEAPDASWSEDERRELLGALGPAAHSTAAQEATAMLGAGA
jgi:hypothetical protein